MNSGIFSTRMIAALIAVGVTSFIGIAAISVFSSDLAIRRDFGASSHSVSAIGHNALVETLKKTGRNIVISRFGSAAKAGDTSLLIAAEPQSSRLLDDFQKTLTGRSFVLYVLPKWRPVKNKTNPLWVAPVKIFREETVNKIADELRQDLEIRRTDQITDPTGKLGAGIPRPDVDMLQLMKPVTGIYPLVTVGDGVLFAQLGNWSSRRYILSDPDLFNNQGLGRGRNAELFHRMIQTMTADESAIVFDETIHGFEQSPDLWRSVFTPPLLTPALVTLTALLLLVLAGVRRFGPPLRRPDDYSIGRTALYDVTATLLEQRGDTGLLGREYSAMVIRNIAAALHLPPTLSREQQIDRLSVIAQRRGVDGDLGNILSHLGFFEPEKTRNIKDVLLWANKLNQWSHEVIYGTR